MNKLLLVAAVTATGFVFADDTATTKTSDNKAEAAVEVQEKNDAPWFWGFGNYGMYSGYQLYGSLLNSEPTLQGYLEGNVNLLWDEWDFGYLGIGVWSNTDLTDKRRDSYGKAFNEWDPNVHYGKTFWFDDDRTWGLDYRTTFVWYYYPHRRHNGINYPWGGRRSTATTMDWNHSFALLNPFIVPFVDVVHEYHESDANLLQFGVKRAFQVTEKFSLTPSATFVWRNSHYNWCFPTQFGQLRHGSGIATMKLMLDANYQITDHIGIFAKVAYCSVIDPDLRFNIDHDVSGADYGDYKDFAWGGFGVSFNF